MAGPTRSRSRFGVHTLAGVAACLMLAACAASEQAATDPAGAQSTGTSSAAFPRVIQHAMGETTIKTPPRTVAALDASYVDAALALETEVVAFTRYRSFGDNLPDYLGADRQRFGARARAIGELESPDVEQLHDIAPDLIISAKVRHEKFYDKFTGAAPTVFSQTTGAIWKDNIRLLGKALGKDELAEKKIKEFEDRAGRVGQNVKAKLGKDATVSLVRFVAGEATVRLYSSASFPGTVLADTGLQRPAGQPDATDKIAVDVSQEDITKLDAATIFVSTWNDDKRESKQVADRFRANPLWAKLTGQVVEVNDLTWVSSVGLHGAHSMLDDIAAHFGVDPAK